MDSRGAVDLLRNATPDDVRQFHNKSDVDSGVLAQHHTLGPKSYQAAAGDHKHDTQPAVDFAPNVRNNDNTALAHGLLVCKFKVVAGVCYWKNHFNVLAASGLVTFTLPVATDFAAYGDLVGVGRENSLTGNMLQVFRQSGTNNAVVFTYNNGVGFAAGTQLILNGSYIVDQVA